MSDIAQVLSQERRRLDRLEAERDVVTSTVESLEKDVAKLTRTVDVLDQVAAILQSIGEEQQNAVQGKIEALLTHGLQTIFGSDISFHIKASTRGKYAATDFVVRSTINGTEVETPVIGARGGGVASVIGFLLRLVIMMLSTDGSRKLLVLDETFAQLSAEYEPALADFIRELADRTGIQIVLVTHSDAYSAIADKLYRFRLVDGKTEVTEITEDVSG